MRRFPSVDQRPRYSRLRSGKRFCWVGRSRCRAESVGKRAQGMLPCGRRLAHVQRSALCAQLCGVLGQPSLPVRIYGAQVRVGKRRHARHPGLRLWRIGCLQSRRLLFVRDGRGRRSLRHCALGRRRSNGKVALGSPVQVHLWSSGQPGRMPVRLCRVFPGVLLYGVAERMLAQPTLRLRRRVDAQHAKLLVREDAVHVSIITCVISISSGRLL